MAGKRLAVRIPGWCEFVSLGGEKLNAPVEKGYAYIDIKSNEETLDFWFEMKPRFVCANPKIGYDAGKVCLCRGPLVYCSESVLNDGVRLSDISLDVNGTVGLTFDEEAGVYAAEADAFEDAPSDELYYECAKSERVNRKIRMLPYFAYANHGESDMAVWLRKG